MGNHRRNHVRLRLERLESRCLLAAGVSPSDWTVEAMAPPLESPVEGLQNSILGPHQQKVQLTASDAAGPLSELTAGYDTVLNNGSSDNRVDIVILGDGYTASQIDTDYVNHVNTMLEYLFNAGQDPYPRYAKFFNAHRINTISNESGADKPPDDVFVDTAFDARYFCRDIERLLCISNSKANIAKDAALAGAGFNAEMQFVSINDFKYGGSGGTYAVFAGANASANELALHEVAHSFDDLADEYGGSPNYTGSEPNEVNVTTNSAGTKWQRWLGYDQPGIGTIAAYEGGRYYDQGIYRPSNNSKMRSLGQRFDAVSREKIILDIYDLIDPIDSWLSNAQTIQSISPSLWIDPIDTDVQNIQWSVDGVEVVGATSDTFNPRDFGFDSGVYAVSARVYDPTDWVRHDLDKLEQTVGWTVEILPAPQVRSVKLNGGETSRSLVTSVTVEFDSTVDVSASSFVLSNRDTSQTVNLQITSSPSATGTVAELTFEKGESVFERLAPALNSLVEANFELKVVGSQVTTSIGDHPMAGDHLFGNQSGDAFFRLFGDSDGDRDVDGHDYGRFGLTFLQSPSDDHFDAWLDMTGDGDVDGQDLGQFDRRLLRTMPF